MSLTELIGEREKLIDRRKFCKSTLRKLWDNIATGYTEAQAVSELSYVELRLCNVKRQLRTEYGIE